MEDAHRDRRLAYGLARIGLGLNIALHGLVRLPHISSFAAGLRPEFAQTILPGSLVELTGYLIVVGEATAGLLVLLGLCLRPALVGGMFLMLVLEFGTCLRQEWNTAGLQLTYIAFYAALIATARYDACSLDRLRRGPATDEPAL
ncbi:MAG TPA: DoxX family membrane protein [Opitutaceae bacterium]|jgi:thiosulfate dehydrogenase [quinone] large subunit|nr:DoxX family membrane protein [Opitutaceae bacterium]